MKEEKKLTGYPSIDKPWLKYYSEKAVNAPLPECTMWQYIWDNNKDHLDDTALIFLDRKISFREMFEQIDRVAAAFISIGVKENDVVTLMVMNQPETIFCLYALNKIGAISCMINILSSPKEIVHYMEECDSKLLVVIDALFDKAFDAYGQYSMDRMIYLPLFQSLSIAKRITYRLKVKKPVSSEESVISWDSFLREASRPTIFPEKNPYSCAIIGHTGGTTGTPKGVMLSDFAVNAVVAQYKMKFAYEKSDTFMNMIIPFAVYGIVTNIHLPLTLGISQIIVPKVNPETTDTLLKKYRPNHICSIPSYWYSIASSCHLVDMSWLKTAGAGGSGMTPELELRLNEKFKECGADIRFLMGYGLSEVCATACVQVPDSVVLGSAGIPLVKNIVSIFDSETGKELKYNETGEICINSPSVMLGYVRNQAETEEVLRKHPDGRIWVHTGDIGYMNENGSVFVRGRMKRVYLTQLDGALAKIFPDRIERVVLQNPRVKDCCIVCVQHTQNQVALIAFVEVMDEAPNTILKKEIINSCRQELPEYAIPAKIVFMRSLPRTAMGKIDYHALEDAAAKE